ncbi:MAG: sulfite exporter TauE/SafE family protein [Fusobacteriaceae bacterium]|nr:sulfite exporter TauE/SafE family protein [Fusobacteriaceae bacterium]
MKEKIKIRIGGMTCTGCQSTIENKLKKTNGINDANVSYNNGTAVITYNADVITLENIKNIIKKLDYNVLSEDESRNESGNEKDSIIGILLIVISVYVLLKQFGVLQIVNLFPTAEIGMSYGMLFVIGVLTSFHCVAMCGGINISRCMPKVDEDENKGKFASLKPSFLYNFGRVTSYTVIGGIIGAIGSVVSLSGSLRGIVQIMAGIFMVIMGLNMLNVFPKLRKFNLRMPSIFAKKIVDKKGKSKNAFYVGLLNGLMPCGPLQAMQLYALSAGNPMKGALSMFLFSMGTVPLMFGLGALSTVLSKKSTGNVMRVGSLLVIILGISMFSNGWSLSGFSLSSFIPNIISTSKSSSSSDKIAENSVTIENGTQLVKSTLTRYGYPNITIQKGIPVKWVIEAPQGTINGCNNRAVINEYGVQHRFTVGENIIEFTPTKAGKFTYTCWMGMIRGTITVTEEAK